MDQGRGQPENGPPEIEEGEMPEDGAEGQQAGGEGRSGYVSPAPAGAGTGDRGDSSPGGRALRPAAMSRGTPRPRGRAGARNRARGSRGSGWARPASVGPSAARNLAIAPAARARSRARSTPGLADDEWLVEDLETAGALEVDPGLGEVPAAATAGGPGRGAVRQGAAASDIWVDYNDRSSSSPFAVWTPAERQRFAAQGGVSAQVARAISSSMVTTFDPDEALDVSEDAVLALFGRDRTAVLRMSGLPMQKESEKEWKMRKAQAAAQEAKNRTVPSGFLAAMWFFSFQYNRNHLLTASPLKVHDVEQWAWMFARWAIAEASDMSKDSEFLQVVSKADSLSVQIQDFLRGMVGSGGSTIPHALRSDIVQVMLRFSTVRARWVAGVVERGVAVQGLRDLHGQMRKLGRVYAHDDSTLEAFIDSLWKQLLTQSAMFVSLQAREAYCARAFLCMASAFICGLNSGPAPVNSNPLDASPAELLGGVLGSAGASAAPAPLAASGTPQGSVQWSLSGATNPLASAATGPAATVQHPVMPAYSSLPFEQEPTLDTMARQTAAGHRTAGPLLGGLSGGGAEGIDLLPQARRVHHAQQVLLGVRAPGPLVSTPPAGILPPVSSYAPLLYSSGPAVPGLVLPPPATLPPPQYSTAQTIIGSLGGGSGGAGFNTGASALRRTDSVYVSDDLHIPYSTGMLGSFSPYRSSALPSTLSCFECQAVQHHYATECPSRFVRVRGEAPPGWRVEGPGRAARDDAAWNGAELTDVARARYRDFVARFSLPPHSAFPITVDEIVGPAPVTVRRSIPRPGGRGRG